MVNVIKDGRTYDTDTATLVHYREGCGGDRYQGLYQTREGEFFFWEYDIGEGWGNIDPATNQEACKWVEEHANHLLKQYFPDGRGANATVLPKFKKTMEGSYRRSSTVAGGTPRSGAKQATLSFPEHMFNKLNLAAVERGVSLSEMVRQLVHHGLDG
jgi:hypothetical protein